MVNFIEKMTQIYMYNKGGKKMGLFSRRNNLDEEQRIIRTSKEEENRAIVDDAIANSLQEANIQEIMQFLDSLKVKHKDKRDLYSIYDKMAEDSIISGALDILSDDIVKKDTLRERRVWAEEDLKNAEETKRIVDKVNLFLKEFEIDKKVWGYAYNLLKYGEVYLKTYKQEYEKNDFPEEFADRKGAIFELEGNPADVLTLEKYGAQVGYGEVKRNKKDDVTEGYRLVKNDEYVHIVADRKMIRENIKLTYKNSDGVEKTDVFKSVVGSSYLESARQAWSIMDLIETLLLYVRFNRSDVFRIVSVEVGSAGRTESTRILRNVKRMFTNQDSMDMKEKTYTGYKKPIPHGENVYVATKQGKGEIKIDDIGGNFDIKEIVDLEYWLNKLVAALKTPKAYLGLEDGNLTGLNNQSLTRQDIRYCRTVESYQECLLQGIKSMCDYYLTETGDGNYVDNYKIVGTKILSAETTDRMEDTTAKIELATALKDFISQIEGVDMNSVTRVIIDKILDLSEIDPEFNNILSKESIESAKSSTDTDSDGEENYEE